MTTVASPDQNRNTDEGALVGADAVAALLASCTVPAGDHSFTALDSALAGAGRVTTRPWPDLVEDLRAAAARPWPNADQAGRALAAKLGFAASSTEPDDLTPARLRKAAKEALADAKVALPAHVGAVLNAGLRGDGEVLARTEIFLDHDEVAPEVAQRLRRILQRAGLNFVMYESCTSRLPLPVADGQGAAVTFPLKLHVRVQLKPIESYRPREAVVEWWRSANAAVRQLLARVGVEGLDQSVGKNLERLCFLPHVPPGGPARAFAPLPEDAIPGRALDLEALVLALGGPAMPRPEAPARPREDVEAEQGGQVCPDSSAGPASPAPAEAAPPDEGPTPGHSNGSLIRLAFELFAEAGLRLRRGYDDDADLGPDDFDESPRRFLGRALDGGRQAVVCPWLAEHGSGRGAESSTVIFLRGGPGGGFSCLHDGCIAANDGSERREADVLRLARKVADFTGRPFPDRAAWGGEGGAVGESEAPSVVVPAEVPPAPPAPAPAPAPAARFALAPDEEGAEHSAELHGDGGADVEEAAPERISVRKTKNVAAMARAAMPVLQTHPKLFTNGGKLLDLAQECGEDRHGYSFRPHIRTTPFPYLFAIMSDRARWFEESVNRRGEVTEIEDKPDRDVVRGLMAVDTFRGVKRLEGLAFAPFFRPDGTLVQSRGYDPVTKVFLAPEGDFPRVPADPSRASLESARADLMYVLSDFPFAPGEEELGRGVWLSAVFTRFLRFAMSGSIPMFVVSANESGSGKGKLVDSAAIIAEGRPSSAYQFAGEGGGGDAEVERIIGASIKARDAVACIDNLPKGTPLSSASLERLLTSPEFGTREVGSSLKIAATYLDCLWFVTGNDVETGTDMRRRVLRINLLDTSGAPSKRKTREADLIAYVRACRPRLAAAALTLLSGFFAARRRGWGVELPQLGSFEAWSALVRKAIVWCGFPDPILAVGKEGDDIVARDRAAFFGMLRAAAPAGTTPKALGELLVADHRSKTPKHGDLYDFLEDKGVIARGKTFSNAFGKWARSYEKTVAVGADGARWILLKRATNSGSLWEVRPA